MTDVRSALKSVMAGESLSQADAQDVINAIMEGQVEPALIAGLLVASAIKGETVDEIAGAAAAMRAHATRVPTTRENIIDTCGTGGDGSQTFNISTVSAFVAAGAGAVVAKHGNRAMSSSFGSADLLEALGVRLDAPPEQVGRSVDEVGIGFMFAPSLHPAMKHAGPVRRALGIRTIFNLLGPMTNPAGAKRQLIGVYAPERVADLCEVLRRLGSTRALVVHGEGGLDEISIAGPTRVAELEGGEIREYTISPEDVGLQRASLDAIRVNNAEQSLAMANAVLDGQEGPAKDVVLLNAGAALYIADVADSLAEGVKRARQSLESGAAREKVGALARAQGTT